MSRTVKDAALATRTSRLKLAPGRRHWRSLGGKVHLGYWRGAGEGKVGRWLLRVYSGHQKYTVEVLRSASGDKVVADDVAEVNGVTVLDFAEAQKRAHAVHGERARIGAGLPAKAGAAFAVADCVRQYCDWLDAHKKTGKDARGRAEALIIPTLGHVSCEKLTKAEIEKWMGDLAAMPPRVRSKKGEIRHKAMDSHNAEARRARQATVNRTWVILRAALNAAWRAGHIVSKEWQKALPFRETDAARVRYFSEDEALRLARAAEPSFAKLVQAALATGCRYSELTALHVEDFHRDSATLHVRKSKSGKGRHVVLGDEGVALFESLCAGRPHDAVMLVRSNGSPWSRSLQQEPMLAACTAARIKPAGFHTLRHTWASLSVMAGMPIMVVAKNLGHRDTTMVEHHYGHLAPSFIADAVRQFAPTFGFAPAKVAALRSRRRPA